MKAHTDLQQYLELALTFIARAKTIHEERLLTKAAARAIADMTKKDASHIEKALHALVVQQDMQRAEYRVTNSVVQPVQQLVQVADHVHGDARIVAGAQLRVGDTLYDRSAESILSDIQHALEKSI